MTVDHHLDGDLAQARRLVERRKEISADLKDIRLALFNQCSHVGYVVECDERGGRLCLFCGLDLWADYAGSIDLRVLRSSERSAPLKDVASIYRCSPPEFMELRAGWPYSFPLSLPLNPGPVVVVGGLSE